MKNAIVVDANDVKGILAKHFGVKPDDVIKSQYSYTVIMDKQDVTDSSHKDCNGTTE